MKLRNKFLIIFLLLSIVPILIFSVFIFNRYMYLVNLQTSQVAENIVGKAESEIINTIQNLEQVTEVFNLGTTTTTSIAQDLSKYNNEDHEYTSFEILESNNKIKFICQNIMYTYDNINGIFIFTPKGPVLGYGYGNGIDVKTDYSPFDETWYKNTLEMDGKLYIDPPSKKEFLIGAKKDSIIVSKVLYDIYTREFLGVLMLDSSVELFDISNVNTLPDIALLILEQGDNIFYSNADELNITKMNKKNYLRYERDLPYQDLKLKAVFNYDMLNQEFKSTARMLIIIAVFMSFGFGVIAIVLSKGLTKPIVYLSKKMSANRGENQLSDEKALNRTDEIGVLYNEYQRYLEELERYVKVEYQNKLIILDSQMKSLEAQVNSHFLYNTLESINSIAEIEEVFSISTMSHALGNMFRYSIKTKSELVPLKDEIRHILNYISIQSIRFDHRFNFKQNIEEKIYEIKVLKLILQPIVENALYHGLKRCSIVGTIQLDGRIQNNLIFITITDDGEGMKEATLTDIREALDKKPDFTELGHRNKESIGIKNIHSRIQLYYGESYGLSIESKENEGTKVEIKLPIIP